MESLKVNLDKKNLAFYRDSQGKSALHHSIEKKHFEIALYLYEKYPVLSKLNDCVSYFKINIFIIFYLFNPQINSILV